MDKGLRPNASRAVVQLDVGVHHLGMVINHALQVFAGQRLNLLHQAGHQVTVQRAHRQQILRAAGPPGSQAAGWARGDLLQLPDALAGIDGKTGPVQGLESRGLLIHLGQHMEGAALPDLGGHLVEQGRQVSRLDAGFGRQERQAGKGSPASVRHLPDQWLCRRLGLAQIGKDAGARRKPGQQSPSRDQHRAARQRQPAVEEQAAQTAAVQGGQITPFKRANVHASCRKYW